MNLTYRTPINNAGGNAVVIITPPPHTTIDDDLIESLVTAFRDKLRTLQAPHHPRGNFILEGEPFFVEAGGYDIMWYAEGVLNGPRHQTIEDIAAALTGVFADA